MAPFSALFSKKTSDPYSCCDSADSTKPQPFVALKDLTVPEKICSGSAIRVLKNEKGERVTTTRELHNTNNENEAKQKNKSCRPAKLSDQGGSSILGIA
mmetsp:Transcript_49515/g.78384  ORF Transcript_49515/g.78384 Transcript_49515/m.78384 type:complete len:99 (-) Transcript_49515:3-299(-)